MLESARVTKAPLRIEQLKRHERLYSTGDVLRLGSLRTSSVLAGGSN
jgi:hypothetical protein